MDEEILEIKISDKIIKFEGVVFSYLYPYLFLYLYKNNLINQHLKEFVVIPKEIESDFLEMLEGILIDLLEVGYKKPTHKNKSKYSSRYIKIKFKDTVYDLNYVNDFVGVVGYRLYLLIKEVNFLNS